MWKLEGEELELGAYVTAMEKIFKKLTEVKPEDVLKRFQEVWKVHMRMIQILDEYGDEEQAMEEAKRFVKLCQDFGVPEYHVEIWTSAMNDIAERYWARDEKQEAERWYERIVKFVEKKKRNGSLASSVGPLLDLEMAYGRLALCVSVRGEEARVEKLLRLQQGIIALLAQNHLCSPKKKVLAVISAVNTLLELAHTSLANGNDERGLGYFKSASQICKTFASLDVDSAEDSKVPTLQDTEENIELGRSSYLVRVGKVEEAETAILQILKKQVARLPSNSIRLIPTYNNLGHVLALQRRYSEAEDALLKAIDLTLMQNDKNAQFQLSDRLYTMQNLLANVLREQGKLEKAIDVQEANVKLAKAHFGPLSQESIASLSLLASTFSLLHQSHQALDTLSTAYYHFRASQNNSENQSLIQPSLFIPLCSQYASALIKNNQNQKAEQVLLETKNHISKIAGKDSKLVIQFVLTSTPLYLLMDKKNVAERDLSASINRLQAWKPSADRDELLSQLSLSLGHLYLHARNLPLSKNQYDIALSYAKRLHAASSPKKDLLVIDSLKSLSKWYTSSNLPPMAISSLKEAISLSEKALGPLHPDTLSLHLDLLSLCATDDPHTFNALSHTLSTNIQASSLSSSRKKVLLDKINSLTTNVFKAPANHSKQ